MSTLYLPTQEAFAGRLARLLAAQPGLPPAVPEAFAAYPRHWFIDRLGGVDIDPTTCDPELLERIYSDQALCLQQQGEVGTSSTSQPSLMAQMMVDAGLRPGARVLEIGTGSGWNAALMAHLVGPTGSVVSVEVDPALAAAAQRHLDRLPTTAPVALRCADGLLGAPDLAPFDAIMVTVACPDIPVAWLSQLAAGGRLVLPYALPDGSAPLLALRRESEGWHGRWLRWAWFVGLRGDTLPDWPSPRQVEGELARRDLPAGPWLQPGSGLRATASLDLWLMTHDDAFAVARYDDRLMGGLWQPDALALADAPELRWRGDAALADRLAAHCQAWQRAGSPKLTDYTVHLADPGPSRNVVPWARPVTPLWLSWPGR